MIYAQYFSQEEFREWSDDMSPRLVTMLDVLRFRLGRPIETSESEYALGRNLGRNELSEHNVDEWGEVLAVDCFISGVYNRADQSLKKADAFPAPPMDAQVLCAVCIGLGGTNRGGFWSLWTGFRGAYPLAHVRHYLYGAELFPALQPTRQLP